jgi:hypothetical protein
MANRAEDAPQNQLDLYHELVAFRRFDRVLADAIIAKLFRHLWYTSEEMVPWALASSKTSNEEKAKIAGRLLEFPRDQLRRGTVG